MLQAECIFQRTKLPDGDQRAKSSWPRSVGSKAGKSRQVEVCVIRCVWGKDYDKSIDSNNEECNGKEWREVTDARAKRGQNLDGENGASLHRERKSYRRCYMVLHGVSTYVVVVYQV